MNTRAPLHGRAMALPLALTQKMAQAFAGHPFACIARTEDGRPIIFAHDLDDRNRLLAGLPADAAAQIAVHAGQYADDYGQIIQPSKGQYILLAASTSPLNLVGHPGPDLSPSPTIGNQTNDRPRKKKARKRRGQSVHPENHSQQGRL